MAREICAALIGLIACATMGGGVVAEEIPVGIDGCALLARAVYSEVSAAATFGPGRSGPWIIDSGQGEIAMCTTTAKTVSRAFTSAMSSAGYAVHWGGSPHASSAHCLNRFLSRCYPNRDNGRAPGVGSDSAFVQKTWSVVSRSVTRQMYNPFSSDEVRFRVNDLKLQLGLSLRAIDARNKR